MANLTSLSDEQLVALCRANDADAWTELCSRYIGDSQRISQKFAHGEMDADDLAQEGLMGFLCAVHSYKQTESTSFATYASVCIHNRIVNVVKTAHAKKQIPYSLRLSIESDGEFIDTSMTPEETLVSKLEVQRIFQAVSARLTQREQEVFRLYMSGLKYGEIADKLSISVKAVEGALTRARKKLKDELRK